tara:strand:+ start:1132 stop:1683 length:552 start_codon:yes stop_codon:yes gene_type:complete
MTSYITQNTLLLNNLLEFYDKDNNLETMLKIINGESPISLRIVDWFVTNFAKQKFTVYNLKDGGRFKVYNDYKLKLKAYSKKRFDPFCRWDRINIPYEENKLVQTTIGQLNFFKWAMENEIIDYINNNYNDIEKDMNNRNSTSKRRIYTNTNNSKTRKKREELSISASKTIKEEKVEVTIKFN